MKSDNGIITGTTAVTMARGPNAGVRVIDDYSIFNPNAAARDVTVQIRDGNVVRRLFKFAGDNALGENETIVPEDGDEIVLDSPRKTLEVLIDAAPSDPLEWTVSWRDQRA